MQRILTFKKILSGLFQIHDWTTVFGRGFVLEVEEDSESNGNKTVLKAFLDLLFSSTRKIKPESDISTIISRHLHIVLGNLNETQLVKHKICQCT